MRTIKFKAITSNRNSDNTWVEGFPIIDEVLPEEEAMMNNGSGGIFDIQRHTICQFTGVQDRDGNDIYEWDELLERFDDGDEYYAVCLFYKGAFGAVEIPDHSKNNLSKSQIISMIESEELIFDSFLEESAEVTWNIIGNLNDHPQ